MEALSESIAPVGGARHETVPIDHLDYGYIEKCSNTKELEKIVKILRSGSEGCYPDLLATAEKRLAKLKPKSDVLRYPKPVMRGSDLNQEELTQFQDDIQRWHDEATMRDKHLREMSDSAVTEANLPPVRTSEPEKKLQDKDPQPAKKSKSQRIKSNDWEAWEKFDADKEIEKIDEDKEEKKPTKNLNCPTTDLPVSDDPIERELQATREKDKGNEAFRAKDYEEAYTYYTRSINILGTAVAYNNRAMAAIKLEKYSDAVNDCNCVLKMDPDNVKAFLRRGSAKQSQGLYKAAEDDLKKVLELEPNNSRGKELLIQVRAQLQNQKTKPNQLDQQKQTEQKPVNQKPAEQRPKGRPIPITEVDNMNDEDDSKEESTTQEEAKSDGKKQETSSNECQITEKLTETSDGMEMGNRCQTGEEAESTTTQEEIESDGKKQETKPSSDECETTEKLTETSDGMEMGNRCQTGEEAESTTQEEVESNGKKQETRPSSDECETTEKLTEASDGTGMENRYYTGEEEENTTETMEEEVDVNRNPSHAVLKEGTDGGNLSQQSEPENEHKDNEDDEEELPPLEDSSNEMPILPSFVPSDPPLPIPLKALELKNEGMSLFRAGDYAHAFEKYSSAIDSMEPVRDFHKEDYATLYSNRAACRNKLGDCQGCISDCDEGLSYNSNNLKLYLRKAAALESLEKFALAYVNYRAALSLDSNVPQAHQACSRLTVHLRDEFGNQWREKLPPQPETNACFPLSQPNHLPQPTTSNIPGASGMPTVPVSEATDAAPAPTFTATPASNTSIKDKFEVMKNKGNQLVAQGKFYDAAKCYTQCIEIDKSQITAFTNRALCHLKLNKPHLAVQDCNSALKLDPQNVKALYRGAQAKSTLGDQRGAAKDLSDLLKIQPTNVPALQELERVKELWRQELKTTQEQKAGKRKLSEKKQQTKKPLVQQRNTQQRQQKPQKNSGTKPGGKTRKSRGNSPTSTVSPLPPPAPPPSQDTTKELRLDDLLKAQMVDPPCKHYMSEELTVNGDTETKEMDVSEAKVTGLDNESGTGSVEEPKRTRVVIQEVASDYESSDDGTQFSKVTNANKEPTMGKPEEQSIETDSNEGPESQLKETQKSTEEAIPLKKLDKGTPYEFLQTWRSVRGSDRVAFAQYAHLLKQIKPESLPTILSNKLDGTMLTTILTTIVDYIVAEGDVEMGYELLLYLTKVPRFSVVSMFLGMADKNVIHGGIEILEKHVESGLFSGNQLDTLKAAFSLC